MLKSGTGVTEDPLWSSSSFGTMSSKSSERERMKEEARKKRARLAAAAYPQIQKGSMDYQLPKVCFEPRKVAPNINDPLIKDIENALGPFADVETAIRRNKLHLLIGIDSSVPGTPEVHEVNFDTAFPAGTKEKALGTTKERQAPCLPVREKHSYNHVKTESAAKIPAVQKPQLSSPKVSHASQVQDEKSGNDARELHAKAKPPKLNMPTGHNSESGGPGKTSSIKIENILKEMTHGIAHPPLTDIQTPVKGSGNKFAFPLPPAKDNNLMQRPRTKSQDSTGSRKNDELLTIDLILSEDETDEDQTNSSSWSNSKQDKLPGMDRSRGLSTSSTSSSDGSSSESESDSDSSDSDSSHNSEPSSPPKEITMKKTHTSTLNSKHVRPKDLKTITKSPLNCKLESDSRRRGLNAAAIKDGLMSGHENVSALQPLKPVELMGLVEKGTIDTLSSSTNLPPLNRLDFSTDFVDRNLSTNNPTLKPDPTEGDFKSESVDSIIKAEVNNGFCAAANPASLDLADKSVVEDVSDAFLDGQVFDTDFEMLDGNLFNTSGHFEKLEEKLSGPSVYPSYDEGLVVNGQEPLEQKAPPELENPQQILDERSRLLDEPSQVLGEPPPLIVSQLMPPNLLSSTERAATSSSLDAPISCICSNPAMELDGILDPPSQSIFTMSSMLPPAGLAVTTNCLPFGDQACLMSDIPHGESLENDMNIQNSQEDQRMMHLDSEFQHQRKRNEEILRGKSISDDDDLKQGIHGIANGNSLRIKLPLTKIRLKGKPPRNKSGSMHCGKGKSIEQIMEAKRAHEMRESQTKPEPRRTVGEKSVRSGKRPASSIMFGGDLAAKHEVTGDLKSRPFRNISEEDEEIDVVGINENSPVKRTGNQKRGNRRTPSVSSSSKGSEAAFELKSNSSKNELLPFSSPKESSIVPNCNYRRTSLGSEVVNKKGEVTTLPASIPYVQVPLKPIRRPNSDTTPLGDGVCSPPAKQPSELRIHIDLKRLMRIPGGLKKCQAEASPCPAAFEVPKRPPKSESESSDMVISPIPSSAENTMEINTPFPFQPEPPPVEVKPPKIPKVEKIEVPAPAEKANPPIEKPEVKKRGRPRKKRDNEPSTRNSTHNPDVCSCGALRRDAARDTIRLGTYRSVYGTYLKEGQKNKHIADCLTKPAEKAQKYIESVLSYVEFLIGLEVTGKTKTRPGMEDFMQTNSACIDLVDHVINHYTRRTNGAYHSHDERFLFLCLRLQSLLYFKLFQIKKDSAIKHAKLLSEYFKVYKQPSNRRSPTSCRPTIKGSTGTPSPMSPGPSPGGSVASVGSAGSTGSSGSSDKVPTGGTVAIPIDMYEKALQYLTYTKYHLHGMRLWEDGDGVVAKCQEFTNNLARRVGFLTKESTMLHVVDYIRAGLDMIREGTSN